MIKKHPQDRAERMRLKELKEHTLKHSSSRKRVEDKDYADDLRREVSETEG